MCKAWGREDASPGEGIKNRGLRNTHGQLTKEEEEGDDL